MTYEIGNIVVPGCDSRLRDIVTSVHSIVAALGQSLGVDAVVVSVIVTETFVEDVQQVIGSVGKGAHEPEQYAVERMGGTAVAKNITHNDDASRVTIVIDSRYLATDSELGRAFSFNLIAHELLHPIFNRLRRQSGPRTADMLPPGPRTAVAVIETALDEFRCDWLANVMLTQVAPATDADGKPIEALTPNVLFGNTEPDMEAMTSAMDAVWVEWPATVQEGREGTLDPKDVWQHVVQGTSDLLIMLAHAEAESRFVSGRGALDRLSDHPAVSDWIGVVWGNLLGGIEEFGVVPDRDIGYTDFNEYETQIIDPAADAVLALWTQLGMHASWGPAGAVDVHLDDKR